MGNQQRPKTPYELLGLNPDCSKEDINKAYRRLARHYHPDINKDANAEHMFKAIKAAKDYLDLHHVEPLKHKIQQNIKDTLFNFRMARAAAQKEKDNPTPPGKIRVTKIVEEDLANALKRWGSASNN